MGQILLADNIPNIVVASTTSVTLASTNLGQTTAVTVGGQQYTLSSTLTLNTGTTGANGLDTGSLGAVQLWYVYAIVNTSTFALALVASQTGPSTGPSMPVGYAAAYKLVGAFYTNGSSQVGSMVQISGPIDTDWMTYTPVTAGLTGVVTASGFWKRSANNLFYVLNLAKDATAPSGSTDTTMTGPVGLQIDNTRISVGRTEATHGCYYQSGTANNKDVTVQVFSIGAPIVVKFSRTNATTAFFNSGTFEASAFLAASGSFPIVGWNTTLL